MEFGRIVSKRPIYLPVMAYPTAGPTPKANNTRPADLPNKGAGMHSLKIGTINGIIIVPPVPIVKIGKVL